MNLLPTLKTLFASLVFLLLLSACDTGDESCCVSHVRSCIDEMDLCAWQCDNQGADSACYAECIFVAKNCALECDDE